MAKYQKAAQINRILTQKKPLEQLLKDIILTKLQDISRGEK